MVDAMIRLFDSTATSFTTNGLGVLNEAISCVVIEERNGSFELEMKYPITGRKYDDITLRKIIVTKSNPYSTPQAFRIYSISKPLNGIITINAYHISYDLSGYPVSPFTASGITQALLGIQNGMVISSPFTLWTDKNASTNVATMTVEKPSSARSLLGGTSGSVLDLYGGEFEFDNYTVKLYENRGSNRGVSIRYGKNLTDIKQEENCESVYTGVYPFWKSEEDGLIELDEKIVYVEGTYDYSKILILDFSSDFDTAPTEEQLRSAANSYITNNNIGIPKVSLDVSFIQLSQSEEYASYAMLEEVHLCDTVNVEFPKLNVSATSKCIKTKYNCITGKYEEISLGSTKSNLSDTISEQNKKLDETPTQSVLEKTVNIATKLITGGLGGYVIIDHHDGTSSKPDEILIMDTPSKETATNVWRWNQNGLGHSSTGYSGTYNVAMTYDGQIVADFITSGIINGSLILADSISANAISQSYKNEVADSITDAKTSVEQAFAAADNQVYSYINNTVVPGINDNIDYITEQTSLIRQTIDALNTIFQSRYTGGINLVKNSTGLNGVSDDWVYTGDLYSQDINEASSGSTFILDTGTMSQEIIVSANKKYTLTCKSKQSTSSTCYARINNGGNYIYIFNKNSQSSSFEEYSITFESSGDSITLEIGSSGSSLYIADIMMTEGEQKSNWTPAPNEIYTKNVKIDKRGINITNAESSTETIIDNTQFAVKHSGDVVLTVNKDLTTLRKTKILDELTICKCKFVQASEGMNLVILD